MKQYTEKTLESPGWYWFVPTMLASKPLFVEVDQETIDEEWLHCKRYTGKYVGPIEPPEVT